MQQLAVTGHIDQKRLAIHAMHGNRLAIRCKACPNWLGIELQGLTNERSSMPIPDSQLRLRAVDSGDDGHQLAVGGEVGGHQIGIQYQSLADRFTGRRLAHLDRTDRRRTGSLADRRHISAIG